MRSVSEVQPASPPFHHLALRGPVVEEASPSAVWTETGHKDTHAKQALRYLEYIIGLDRTILIQLTLSLVRLSVLKAEDSRTPGTPPPVHATVGHTLMRHSHAPHSHGTTQSTQLCFIQYHPYFMLHTHRDSQFILDARWRLPLACLHGLLCTRRGRLRGARHGFDKLVQSKSWSKPWLYQNRAGLVGRARSPALCRPMHDR